MIEELSLLRELVNIFGVIGTLAILAVAAFLYWTKHRSGSAPQQAERKESHKARESINLMRVTLGHVESDITELKGNMKEDRDTVSKLGQNLTTHLENHD